LLVTFQIRVIKRRPTRNQCLKTRKWRGEACRWKYYSLYFSSTFLLSDPGDVSVELAEIFTKTILPWRNTAGLCWLGTTGYLKTLDIHNRRVNHQSSACVRNWVGVKRRRLESGGRKQTNARAANPKFLHNRIYGKISITSDKTCFNV
jgi:hypothetical protein